MFKNTNKNNDPIINTMKNTFIMLPTPINISSWWNFGSILGLLLIIQIISGLLLAMHYCPNTILAFESIIHIMQNVYGGWYIRNMHMNGASLFFICLYLHIWRGLYYHSYNLTHVWLVGVMILLMSMMTAFLGYVLPWGQMSYWGATVITNLLTAIPYFGEYLITWIWGNYSISTPTLGRFFVIHYLIPIIMMMLIIMHLSYLHMYGSNNPNGISSNYSKIIFHPYFTWMDLLGFSWIMLILFMIIMYNPWMFSDPDNFIPASQMSTPKHIQPEWYFLFAYAILRSIPNKLGGVIGLIMSIIILMILPFNGMNKFKSTKFYIINQIYFWIFISSCIILTWVGAKTISYPYIIIAQMNALIYFSYFINYPILNNLWDKIIFMKI